MTDWVTMEWKCCEENRKGLRGGLPTRIRGVFTSARLTGTFSFSKDGTPSQIGSLHHASQRFSQVRRDRMPVVQSIFCHNEFAVGIEHHEVCITPRGNPALARVTTGQSGRGRCHPACHIAQCESSPACLTPHQRQSYGKACNTPPGASEVALRETLQSRRTRRMVGHHQIDRPISQALPQSLAIFT